MQSAGPWNHMPDCSKAVQSEGCPHTDSPISRMLSHKLSNQKEALTHAVQSEGCSHTGSPIRGMLSHTLGGHTRDQRVLRPLLVSNCTNPCQPPPPPCLRMCLGHQSELVRLCKPAGKLWDQMKLVVGSEELPTLVPVAASVELWTKLVPAQAARD